MSADPKPSTPANETKQPVAPSPASAAEAVATQFVAEELEKARSSLKKTRLVGIILLVFVASYMSFITISLTGFLEPKNAAEVANGVIAEQVDLKATDIADQLKTKIPSLIAQLPDFVVGKLPEYREALENKVETDLTDYCLTASAHMGKQMDDFLVEHKENIGTLLKTADDKESLKLLAADIEQELLSYLEQKNESGESIKEKLDTSLDALKRIEKHVERLATAKDLTPQEKKTRRAIAIVSRKLEKVRAN